MAVTIDSMNSTWNGTAFSNVLTFVTLSGDVVQPGHQVKFVPEELGSCAGVTTLSSDYGGTVNSHLEVSFRLSGGGGNSSSDQYVPCHTSAAVTYTAHTGSCKSITLSDEDPSIPVYPNLTAAQAACSNNERCEAVYKLNGQETYELRSTCCELSPRPSWCQDEYSCMLAGVLEATAAQASAAGASAAEQATLEAHVLALYSAFSGPSCNVQQGGTTYIKSNLSDAEFTYLPHVRLSILHSPPSAPPPSPPPMNFAFISSGRCVDTPGYVALTTAAECSAAGLALGFTDSDGVVATSSYWDRPCGCTWHNFGNLELWHTYCSTTMACNDRGYAGCLCSRPFSPPLPPSTPPRAPPSPLTPGATTVDITAETLA
eukprot:3112542-Prymnesium_polylepis.1